MNPWHIIGWAIVILFGLGMLATAVMTIGAIIDHERGSKRGDK